MTFFIEPQDGFRISLNHNAANNHFEILVGEKVAAYVDTSGILHRVNMVTPADVGLTADPAKAGYVQVIDD